MRNAHTRGRFLLKMDFKDFFPSLKAVTIFECFGNGASQSSMRRKSGRSARYSSGHPRVRHRQNCASSIGAPTSPLLSNILMGDFDRHIYRFCRDRQISYTRYADDLSFSSKHSEVLAEAEMAVVDFCCQIEEPGARCQ